MDFSQLFSVEAIEQNVLPYVLGLGARGVRGAHRDDEPRRIVREEIEKAAGENS